MSNRDTTFENINKFTKIRFIDLFCGIGGFHVATDLACNEKKIHGECVFASDIDQDCQKMYEANFGIKPFGDITQIHEKDIPDHDILFAGFPCQAFSICGDRKGFDDTRGTLFFEIARILKEKKPNAFILENVRQLKSHDSGKTLKRIIEACTEIGYHTEYSVLNALDFGVPQKRERIFIVGFLEFSSFAWPQGNRTFQPLSEILDQDVPAFYYASEKIRQNRLDKKSNSKYPHELTIWHENKGGNIGIHPYSCALRAGASYNYLLVNGERRLTEREMLRLQGFPDSYKIICGYSSVRKQAGNSIAIPCISAVLGSVLSALESKGIKSQAYHDKGLVEKSIQGVLDFDNLLKKNDIGAYHNMRFTVEKSKERLNVIIDKARVDLYKPIQIAEVLRHSRIQKDINIADLTSFRNISRKWRDEITQRLTGKKCTSSAKYQDDIWNTTAMPIEILSVLDTANKENNGAVERYIYTRYSERHGTVSQIILTLEAATPQKFQLNVLLDLFITAPGIRRSIDKAYEIVAYSLFETVVSVLETKIKVSVPKKNKEMLEEFADLAKILLGLDGDTLEREEDAHIYRVGVTNAADRGLDMWANFGPAVQVKHLTLNSKLATEIVDQVESDCIVIVCKDIDAKAIEAFTKQISWGKRVRGIVKEKDLIEWYDRCLRGKFANYFATPLLNSLVEGFKAEFPQAGSDVFTQFLNEREYLALPQNQFWLTETELQLGLDASNDD